MPGKEGNPPFMSMKEYERTLEPEDTQPNLVLKQMKREGLNFYSNPRDY